MAIFALSVYKFGSVVLTGTDNIFIAWLIGVASVGLVANVVLIISSVNAVVTRGFEGLLGTIGSLNASESTEVRRAAFFELFLAAVFGVCGVSLAVLVRPFILVWVGPAYAAPQRPFWRRC